MSMSHHGEGFRQSELLKRFQQQAEGTAKREWPEGRVNGTDDGVLAFKVGGDPDQELVIVDFGKPVAWASMGPQDAISFAQMLIRAARAVAKTPVRVVL